MKQHIENTRRQLGELGALAHKTQEDERRILSRAERLLSDADAEITRLRSSQIVGNKEAEDRYTHLIEERGRLQMVIASAKQVLAEPA